MGNILTGLKRFLSNKNTVSLLAIIVCTVILYLFYNNRVNNAVSTSYICYATQTIPARTKITEEMTGEIKVLTSQISSNMVTSCSQVVGKYASYASEIPVNGYFYDINLMEEKDMPDSSFDDIPDGHTLYRLPVTFESTYGNSVFPDDLIDLYVSTTDEAGLPIYGKFIERIKVLGVKDAEGKNVFDTTIEARTPSQLLFSVPEDLFLLLKKAEIVGLTIEVIPRNNNYTAEAGSTKVSSNYIKELILNQTGSIPDECVLEETPTAECESLNSNNNQNTNTDNSTETNNNQAENENTNVTE